ncbi:hypothetical protein J6590_009995 [Homalodisca vitripennis]|nr:hypothetical protein J6590_009995 [Homalodisca vitripennis]
MPSVRCPVRAADCSSANYNWALYRGRHAAGGNPRKTVGKVLPFRTMKVKWSRAGYVGGRPCLARGDVCGGHPVLRTRIRHRTASGTLLLQPRPAIISHVIHGSQYKGEVHDPQ